MEDEKEFTAGSPDFAPRSQLAPWHQDPRAMFRTVAGLASAPGMAQAGLGMLGGAMRAIDPAEKMFRAAAPAVGGMLGLGAAQAGQDNPNPNWQQELREIEDRRANAAKMTPEQQMRDHMRRIQILRGQGLPVTYERNLNVSEAPGMLEQIARAPAPRPSGAGDRRDKRLRDAEDADTKTS